MNFQKSDANDTVCEQGNHFFLHKSPVSEEEVIPIRRGAVPKNTKMETKYLVVSYLIFPTSYSREKTQNTMPCLQKMSNAIITAMQTIKYLMFFSMEFQRQDEFHTAIKEMTVSFFLAGTLHYNN